MYPKAVDDTGRACSVWQRSAILGPKHVGWVMDRLKVGGGATRGAGVEVEKCTEGIVGFCVAGAFLFKYISKNRYEHRIFLCIDSSNAAIHPRV